MANRNRPTRRAVTLLGLFLLLALFALPLAPLDPYVLHLLILVCISAISAIGLNLMLGYTGLVSLGHMAFAGVGAYVAALVLVDAKLSFWLALPLAAIGAAAVAAIVGIICLRFRSHFFMIVTLAFGLLLYSVFNNWDTVTRGAVGFAGIPRPRPIDLVGTRISFAPLENFYWLTLLVTAGVFWLQRRLVDSDFGRTLVAIREDERLARALGVDTAAYKIAVFAIGGGLAGIGGALGAVFLRVAAPASFNLAESINAVLVVVLGGAGTLWGPIIGAAIFIGLPEALRMANEWRLVVFGALLVLAMRFAPAGIVGLIAIGVQRVRLR